MYQSFDNVFNESYLNSNMQQMRVGTMNNKNFWSTFEITGKNPAVESGQE